MSGSKQAVDAAELERQRAEERAASDAAATEANVSETVEGGRYKNAAGVLVNANGEELGSDGKVKK